MREEIKHAILAGADYLISHQGPDGHWQEYRLPVGASDAWVTAYIGLALQGAALDGASPAARMAAERAAEWLIGHRPYPAGWGYNGTTGADADSTAHAVALIRAVGIAVPPQDTEWLLDRWQPGGGFATFAGPGSWGCAHLDITPICFRALDTCDQARLRPALLEYLRLSRRADGSWPSYWWRTCFYTTHACLQLIEELEHDSIPVTGLAAMHEVNNINSAFDLAFAAGIAALAGQHELRGTLANELLRHQRRDGSWAGAEELRVTDPGCYRPWEQPQGRLYADLKGLMATATSISILRRL